MAKLGNIYLNINEFFTNTRVKGCLSLYCIYNREDGNCNLKEIVLDEGGRCKSYQKKRE